jgi:hypothetical protein
MGVGGRVLLRPAKAGLRRTSPAALVPCLPNFLCFLSRPKGRKAEGKSLAEEGGKLSRPEVART